MFLPTTLEEMKDKGWKHLDVILITGDTYIDSPHIGIAVIGNLLAHKGYKVGVIAQPDTTNGKDIMRLGEPKLFWGVSSGSVDSMVANYTPLKKKRRSDDFTPGGYNINRPDRAVIVYSNLIKRYFKNTRPIVLGGIEASLRRIAHYDYWDNSIRRSVLFDAKADALIYGMAERAVIEFVQRLEKGDNLHDIPGICYIAKEPKDGFIMLPSYQEIKEDKARFAEMFKVFYENNDPLTAQGLCQRHDTRYLIHNPPSLYPAEKELDDIYEMPFERQVHPYYLKQGIVRAMDTIRFSITTHRGCYGECNFCAIALHQGRTVTSRSIASVLRETGRITNLRGFKGYITDLGGPTANMYQIECHKKLRKGACRDKRCLFPTRCSQMSIDHSPQIMLLRQISAIPAVKKAFVASGIRYDMIMDDAKWGISYLRELSENHISGQMKIAPEHIHDETLRLMGKPGRDCLLAFKDSFERIEKQLKKRQFLTYYFIAAHPGCDEHIMRELKGFSSRELKINPEQVQIFTPLPSTYSTLMYYTGIDPFTGRGIFVERDTKRKDLQKQIMFSNKR